MAEEAPNAALSGNRKTSMLSRISQGAAVIVQGPHGKKMERAATDMFKAIDKDGDIGGRSAPSSSSSSSSTGSSASFGKRTEGLRARMPPATRGASSKGGCGGPGSCSERGDALKLASASLASVPTVPIVADETFETRLLALRGESCSPESRRTPASVTVPPPSQKSCKKAGGSRTRSLHLVLKY